MARDLLKLSNQLCFPLYAAAKEVVGRYKPFLSKIDLTYTQYIAMLVMWEFKSVGVKELGEHLHLDSGTLTPLLKRLELKGLVRRERSEKDERTVKVSITQKGELLKRQAARVPEKLAECMPLTQKESKALYALLYKLLDAPK
jgi:DNA-binding MarR family transcriptional regulator